MTTESAVTTLPEVRTLPLWAYACTKNGIPGVIPDRFGTPGFNHQLIERSGDVAIFAQTNRTTGSILAYEVLIVRRYATHRRLPGGAEITAGSEYLPSTREWGSYAWTVPTLDAARAKAEEHRAA